MPLLLPNANQTTLLQGINSPVSLSWWRWFQAATSTLNAIPDTAVIAQLQSEIATLSEQVSAAQAAAEAAAAQAAQAVAQTDNTLSYVALGR
jgi:hypothetical protein